MLKSLKSLPVILLSGLVLAACSGPPSPAPDTVPADAVATQVALLLTSSPVASPTQPLVETATPPPTETELPPTPTPTDTPEPTATDTPTPLPTSTPSATDPRETLGNPTFRDATFKDNQNWGKAWDGDFTRGEFKNNQLVLTSVGVDGWTLTWPKPADFYIEMTATTGNCAGMDRYGIIVRVPDSYDRGYLVGFSCDGKYSLRLWNPDEKRYTNLINWTPSNHINSGSNQTNRVGLKAVGSRFELYANGHFLGEANDSELTEGRFGPFIGHDKTDDFTIHISEFAYWSLP